MNMYTLLLYSVTPRYYIHVPFCGVLFSLIESLTTTISLNTACEVNLREIVLLLRLIWLKCTCVFESYLNSIKQNFNIIYWNTQNAKLEHISTGWSHLRDRFKKKLLLNSIRTSIEKIITLIAKDFLCTGNYIELHDFSQVHVNGVFIYYNTSLYSKMLFMYKYKVFKISYLY